FPELYERSVDVIFSILSGPWEAELRDDLKAEFLFNDQICLATGQRSPWARRRKIDFADLADAYWIMPPAGAPGETAVSGAFRPRHLPPPRVPVRTFSFPLLIFLGVHRHFIAVLPSSILRLNADMVGLKMLPIELPSPPRPVVAITLK